jgi:predicted membrane protein
LGFTGVIISLLWHWLPGMYVTQDRETYLWKDPATKFSSWKIMMTMRI